MESCQKCGHIRYAGDLFDGGCSDCCDWMVARLAELTAERDALKAKLAEAARLARDSAKAAGEIVGQQWQPIETAPKDGTSVLLFADNWGEPVVGSFAYSHDENGDETEVRDWFSSFGDTLDEPEHWMPLPEPPKESSHD